MLITGVAIAIAAGVLYAVLAATGLRSVTPLSLDLSAAHLQLQPLSIELDDVDPDRIGESLAAVPVEVNLCQEIGAGRS